MNEQPEQKVCGHDWREDEVNPGNWFCMNCGREENDCDRAIVNAALAARHLMERADETYETKELRGPPINEKLFCPQTGEWLRVANLDDWHDEASARNAERYLWLKEKCGHAYGESYAEPSPAECGIHFDWQQSKPGEALDIDEAIDAAMAAEKYAFRLGGAERRGAPSPTAEPAMTTASRENGTTETKSGDNT